jgi:hypothetical protein
MTLEGKMAVLGPFATLSKLGVSLWGGSGPPGTVRDSVWGYGCHGVCV